MTNYAEITVEEAALTGMAIAAHAANKPDGIAVIDQQQQRLNWYEFNAKANQLAHYFRDLGLGPNDGVAMLCGNRVEFPLVFMAAMRMGVRVTPINWHLTAPEIAYIVDNCDAQVFIAEQRFMDKAIEAAAAGNRLQSLLSVGGDIPGFESLADAIGEYSPENIDNPVHGGGMLYTSGTTGRPKGVYRAQRPPVLPDYTPRWVRSPHSAGRRILPLHPIHHWARQWCKHRVPMDAA